MLTPWLKPGSGELNRSRVDGVAAHSGAHSPEAHTLTQSRAFAWIGAALSARRRPTKRALSSRRR